MHASNGRQVTVRYVRAGGLLGVPSMVAGTARLGSRSTVDAGAARAF